MTADIAGLILKSGRSGVELALFVLLPVMIVMLTTMRLLEGWGVLDRIVKITALLNASVRFAGIGRSCHVAGDVCEFCRTGSDLDHDG